MTRRLGRYQELLNRAADEAQKHQLSELIVMVGIPADLSYWFDGLRRTRLILQHDKEEFDELLQAVGSPETTQTWLDRITLGEELARPMIESPDDPMSLEMGTPEAGKPHPLAHFCLSVCPHWTALFYEQDPSATPEQQNAYKALQAIVLRCVLAAHVRTRDVREFLDLYQEWRGITDKVAGLKGDHPVRRIEAASRSLRRLAHVDFAPYIEWFVREDETLIEMCDAVGEQLDNAATPAPGVKDVSAGLRGILGDLRRLGELVLGTVSVRSRGPSAARGETRREWPDGYIRITRGRLAFSVEQLDDETRLLRIFECADRRKLSPSDWDEPGPPPIDASDQSGMTIMENSDAWEGPRRLQSERQVAQIARQSTAPTHDRASLTHWQVTKLLNALPKVESELRSYLIVSLATGRDLAMLGLPILSRIPSRPPKIAFLAGAQPAWIVRIDPPAFADASVTNAERRTTSVLKLPDLLGFAACLGQPAPSIVTWSSDIRPRARTWLRQELWDPSLCLGALDSFLSRRLLELTGGELGLQQLLLGSPWQHAQSSAHYTARSLEVAVKLYRRALRIPDITMPATLPNTPALPCEAPEDAMPPTPPDEQVAGVHAGEDRGVGSASAPSVAIGARRVPTVDSVRALLKALAGQAAETTGTARRNALTAYTLVAFNVGAAGRGFGTRRLQDVIRPYGLIVLAEKGKAYNERLVPLAPTLAALLDAYLNALAGWGYRPEGPYGLFCWWNGGIGPEEPFTPKRFSALAGALGFDLELYALRRFARSELIERGAPPEDVDALMGHWLDLLSPHDKLSTYPIRRLRALANGAVELLLRDLEIQASAWTDPIRLRKAIAHDTVETPSQAPGTEAPT
jgi:integrase